MTTFEITSQLEFESAMKNIQPNREYLLWEGDYETRQIVGLDRNILRAKNPARAWTTKIKLVGQGVGFRCHESEVKDITMVGAGGRFLSLEGNNNRVINFYSKGGDRAITSSGKNNYIEGGILAFASGNPIDGNGGFRWNEALGKSERIPEDDPEYASPDQNLHVNGVITYRCGGSGGTWSGGNKYVPRVESATIENCVSIEDSNAFWFDFPAKKLNVIKNCVAIASTRNAFWFEGANSHETREAKGQIIDCFAWAVPVGIFASAHPNVETYGNFIGFRQHGKKIHGIKFTEKQNRIFTYSNTPDGKPADILCAMDADWYTAHSVSYRFTGDDEQYNYDHDRDELWTITNLTDRGILETDQEDEQYDDDGIFVLTGDTNISGPLTPVEVKRMTLDDVPWPQLPNLDAFIGAPVTAFLSAMYNIPITVFGDAPVVSPPSDPGTGDPGTGDPGTGDPGTGDPGGDPDPGTGGTSYLEGRVVGLEIDVADLKERVALLESSDPGTDPGTGPGTNPGAGNPVTGKKIFIFQNDGNAEGRDTDNISATPIAALIAEAMGAVDDTYFFINNWQAQASDPVLVSAMREGANFASSLGITTSDYEASEQDSLSLLVALLSSGQKVVSLEGGRMQMIDRALGEISSRYYPNIELVSHSRVNEGALWDKMKSKYPGVTFTEIDDQNKFFKSEDWNYLDSATDPKLVEARRIMKLSQGKENDPSDAGMFMYLATGSETATVQDFKDLF